MIVAETDRMISERLEPSLAGGRCIDIYPLGKDLVLAITVKAFFGNGLEHRTAEIGVIFDELQDEVGDVSGFASLSKAAGKIGDFLFVDIDLAALGYDVTTKLTVYNARDARELYKVEYQVFNWAGLDGVLFQPVMNGFFDWVDANSAKRKAAAPAPAAVPASAPPVAPPVSK